MSEKRKTLIRIYEKLFKAFGPRHWWPAKSPFEVIVGTILTQNTAWKNVEKAVYNLKKSKLLTPKRLRKVEKRILAKSITPAGYYNIKADRIKNFIDFLFSEFNGNLEAMFKLSIADLRKKLLGVKGIGPETADSIILYAAKMPVFVVDSYTKRIFVRHRLVKPDADYNQIQELFANNLPAEEGLFNEYHALIVQLAKEFCRKEPRCSKCPLKAEPTVAQTALTSKRRENDSSD